MDRIAGCWDAVAHTVSTAGPGLSETITEGTLGLPRGELCTAAQDVGTVGSWGEKLDTSRALG